jgi:hypothetical protein
MKINGLSIAPPKPQYIVFPHGESEIVFLIQGVFSFDEFDKLAPEPQPPSIMYPGGKTDKDFNDKKYIEALETRDKQRITWMYLKALEPSDLEYEKVKIEDPDTYKHFEEEFDIAGIAPGYVRFIKEAIINLSGFNHEMVTEATQRFLAGLEQQTKPSSPSTEQPNT